MDRYMDGLRESMRVATDRIAQQADIYTNVPRWGAEPRRERVVETAVWDARGNLQTESRPPFPGGEKGTCVCGKPRL
jgi:hypothetical protein